MSVSVSLAELAATLGAELQGADPSTVVSGINSLTRATAQEVSFFSNRRYRADLLKTQAAAVILNAKDHVDCPVPVLLMENPYLGYALAAAYFNPPLPKPIGIHPSAWVSPEATLGHGVYIGAQAVVEARAVIEDNAVIGAMSVIGVGVHIGEGSQLIAQVTLCTGTKIGKRVVIQPGAVIGADGFGLANHQGQWIKVPQLGGVIIGDDVEIGANTTIDKGALEDTIIERGVKLDNQIQIAHNVHIGEHTAIAGCVGIAGSTRIGRYCMIAGGVGIVGHIELVDHVHVTGGSIILQSILSPGVYSSGTPLELNHQWHRNYHRFKQLDDMAKRLTSLEKTLK
ncbi:UDP-3-O-(3-hydroxymyristoyl) glucosamine N-acyltransferase [Beggiatoa alba B18LD]|uniref:UDP-3-O-acylglucosamine N-acyltransferase n=1 Tax=Beggiatoa alba B18LD TaxID=395493 RepID=I3CKE5_9GAMM|nr:UDP-3-O-(3-hydroxymyristoyl)glucosamine N-acyltransferase [Beggiatoa alba]EIJ44088.1 UDP-3-O-(3-hydroxymyristoyl) glucosamine N-acyltransferase [Beggiatoa alba B18LD]